MKAMQLGDSHISHRSQIKLREGHAWKSISPNAGSFNEYHFITFRIGNVRKDAPTNSVMYVRFSSTQCPAFQSAIQCTFCTAFVHAHLISNVESSWTLESADLHAE